MPKLLVIAEKPSVARDIASALGGFEDQGEYLESDDFVVTWAVGHLLELAEPQDYDAAYKSWSIKNLPIIPTEFQFKPRDGQKKRLELIKKLGKREDVVGAVNACDAGREGELIYRTIATYTGVDKLPQQRLWLQSMTAAAIRDGFAHLRAGKDLDPLGDAAWCRSVGDWLVGMNATRALTQRLKSRGEKFAWSAGRVQTPTLNMLVQREHEILAHVPRPYWELVATFTHAEQTWEGRYWDPNAKKDDEDPEASSSRIFDEAHARSVLAATRAAGSGSAAEKRKTSRQAPPLPFDLTTLQRESNRRFGYSAKRTLDAAQRLYEAHKLITYPRTDSRHLPEDYGPTIDQVLGALQADVAYAKLADGVVATGPQNLDKVLDSSKVSDHFAIIPTGSDATASGAADPSDVSPGDLKVYDLIVRQFLAALMGPATWATVERVVTVSHAGVTAKFRTTARSLEIPGFQEALGREAGSGTDLPALIPGRDDVDGLKVAVTDVTDEQKETRPRPRYSEANLLRMMETAGETVDEDELSGAMKDRGLGTPATRAETIEGLVRKTYARRVDGKLGPTAKGMRLLDIINRVDVPALASPRLTGEWEYALHQVQAGELPRAKLFDRLTGFTREMVDALVGFDHDTLYTSEPPLGPCPNCGIGQVRETAWGYPCSRNTGAGSECSFMVWKERSGRYIDRALVQRLIAQRKVSDVTGFVDRFGRSLVGTLDLSPDPETGKWTLTTEFGASLDGQDEVEVGVLGPSPVDPDDEIVETSLRWISRKVLDGKTRQGPTLPKVVCHRELTGDEAAAYFSEAGKTDILDGFLSKRGRPFRGALFRKPTGKHGFEFPPREPRPGKDKADDAPPKGKAKTAKAAPTAKASAAKAPAKKAPAKKAPAKKASATAADAPEAPAKKAPAKKAPAKKAPAKKASAKEAPATAAAAAPEAEAASKPARKAVRRPRTPKDGASDSP